MEKNSFEKKAGPYRHHPHHPLLAAGCYTVYSTLLHCYTVCSRLRCSTLLHCVLYAALRCSTCSSTVPASHHPAHRNNPSVPVTSRHESHPDKEGRLGDKHIITVYCCKTLCSSRRTQATQRLCTRRTTTCTSWRTTAKRKHLGGLRLENWLPHYRGLP